MGIHARQVRVPLLLSSHNLLQVDKTHQALQNKGVKLDFTLKNSNTTIVKYKYCLELMGYAPFGSLHRPNAAPLLAVGWKLKRVRNSLQEGRVRILLEFVS